MTPSILVVDDDRTIRESLISTLADSGYRALGAEGVQAARRVLAGTPVDAVLLDIRLRDGDGLELLRELRRDHPRLPVIMATAYGDSDRTIAAMKVGAFEYIVKPFDLDRLLAVLARAVRPADAAYVAPVVESSSALVGSSGAMHEVWKAIGRAAASDVPVLITGESGTGKELVARAIHDNSARRDEPFVAVNLAALPTSLVESELFGHEKGAFTGAVARREGRFELASRGTLFLDEIGDLEFGLQTKLLRVLEDGRFERVGATSSQRSEARIVAATSRPVEPKTPGTALREDLYYRLGVVRIELPPLRERRSDIPLLVEAFLRRIRGPRRALSEGAMARLMEHAWPGNVRELRHVLERACVMSASEVLDEGDLGLPAPLPAAPDTAVGDLDLRRHLERLELSLIRQALARARNNRTEAARLLGIRRGLLYARMKELNLGGDEPPEEP